MNALEKSINCFFIKFFKLNVLNFLMLKIDLKFKQALSKLLFIFLKHFQINKIFMTGVFIKKDLKTMLFFVTSYCGNRNGRK